MLPLLGRIIAGLKTGGKMAAGAALFGDEKSGHEAFERTGAKRDPYFKTDQNFQFVHDIPEVRPEMRRAKEDGKGETVGTDAESAFKRQVSSTTANLEAAGEAAAKALESQGSAVSQAIESLDKALRASRSAPARAGSTPSPDVTPVDRPTKPEEEKTEGLLENLPSKLGGLKTKVGAALAAGGGFLAAGLGASWLGESLYGKEKMDEVQKLRDEPWLRMPEFRGFSNPFADNKKVITFKATDMKFDFGRVTGLSFPTASGGDDSSGDAGTNFGPGTDYNSHSPQAGFDELVAPTGSRGLQTSKKGGEVAFDPSLGDVSKRGIQPFSPPGVGTKFKSPVEGRDLNDPGSVPYDGGSRNSRSFGGNRSGKLHTGVDIPGAVGDPIYATKDGVIRRAEMSPSGYGWTVDVEYADGTVHRNAHMDHIGDGIKVGSKVKAGQSLGAVGTSGNADAGFPHNHYEVIKKDYYDQHKGRPPGRASSEEELHAGRVDPRQYYASQHSDEDIPNRKVAVTEHGRNIPYFPDKFFAGGPAQPQGSFVGSNQAPPPPEPKAEKKVVVNRGESDKWESPSGDRKKKKKDPDKTKDDRVKFAEFLGVDQSE
jgi:murein DD-endopeptidase MepM/ murein hydrolase activator NlpD